MIPRGQVSSNSEDIGIDIKVTNGTAAFRLTRILGGTSGTALIKMEVIGPGTSLLDGSYISFRTLQTDTVIPLNYFDGENGEQKLTGSWAGGLVYSDRSINVVRKGKIVSINIQPFLVTRASGANTDFSVSLPSWAQPSTLLGSGVGLVHPVIVYQNGIPVSGYALINTVTRVLSINTLDTLGWSGSGLNGWAGGQSISYQVI